MRLLIALLYVLLTLGAVTMVYPFLVLIGTSFTSTADKDEFQPVPAYLTNDTWLFRKYVEAKYNENISKFNTWLANDVANFKDLERPPGVGSEGVRRRVGDWLAFRDSLPDSHWLLGGIGNLALRRVTPENLIRYREFLQARYKTVAGVNLAYRQGSEVWQQVTALPEKWDDRSFQPMPSREFDEYLGFKRRLPKRFRIPVNGDGLFQEWLRLRYGAKVEDLNRAWGTAYRSRFDVRIAEQPPRAGSARYRADWEEFVRKQLPAQFVVAGSPALPVYRQVLRRKYGTVDLLNRAHGARFAEWDAVEPPLTPPLHGRAFADWMEFVERAAPVENLSLVTPDAKFRGFLQHRYDTLDALNAAHHAAYRSWGEPALPLLEADWVEMEHAQWPIRTEFLLRNYRDVVNYVALHGPAVWNTVVLCAGLLLFTLIVNPLCAYALSRYNLPATYKILLFLLATMAFPAEVSAIPNFLLLKQLNLLNTYWALILPAVANGYSIFLLKGFFDSLPKELYEAATIDGASEASMFRVITLPLSRPVLAVIALGTFTAAYGSFIWAFLVCQDPRKWTLMVWLSQMQASYPMPVMFAALVLAAVPTLLVFLFCQNLIMRGIIVPTEK